MKDNKLLLFLGLIKDFPNDIFHILKKDRGFTIPSLIMGVIFGDLMLTFLAVQAFTHHDMFYDRIYLLYGLMASIFLYFHLTIVLMLHIIYQMLKKRLDRGRNHVKKIRKG